MAKTTLLCILQGPLPRNKLDLADISVPVDTGMLKKKRTKVIPLRSLSTSKQGIMPIYKLNCSDIAVVENLGLRPRNKLNYPDGLVCLYIKPQAKD